MRVGECETDQNGRIIRLERECFGQGWIFKDWEAFRNRENAPCYVPELHDTAYTKKDFVVLCGGLFLTSDAGKCPHCGTEYPEE